MVKAIFLSVLLAIFAIPFELFAVPVIEDPLVKGIYGLESVPFDDLTRMLEHKVQDHDSGLSHRSGPKALNTSVIIKTTSNVDVFKQLFDYIAAKPLNTEADFYALGSEIAALRNSYREQASIEARLDYRDILFLLQMIQEEVLYVGYTKYNSQSALDDGSVKEKSWSWAPNELKLNASEEEVVLRGMPIRNGDVLLSKASGAGSSSFIALTGDAPHIFSHATIAIITQIFGKQMLVSPEAEIEDGVKLRTFDDYRAGVKTRLFVYRLVNMDNIKKSKIRAATERFVKRMFAITPNPFKFKAFNYDFDLHPDTEGAYYCAAVPCRIYRDSNLDDSLNPYPRTLWGEPTKIRRAIYDFLSLPKRASAAPGDLETNREYELIGSEIQLHRLELERVELAIIDSMFDLLSENQEVVKEIVDKTAALGDEPIKNEELMILVEKGILSQKSFDKIPTHIKPKQMIFFGYLNEVFTPKIRKIVMDQLLNEKHKGKILGLQELRVLAYQAQEERLHELVSGAGYFIDQLVEGKRSFIPAVRCAKALMPKSIIPLNH